MTETRVCRICKLAIVEGTVCELCRREEYERWARRFDLRRIAHRVRRAS
jgi:hypothetical protein